MLGRNSSDKKKQQLQQPSSQQHTRVKTGQGIQTSAATAGPSSETAQLPLYNKLARGKNIATGGGASVSHRGGGAKHNNNQQQF